MSDGRDDILGGIRKALKRGPLDPAAARDYLRETEDRLGLPCVDPVRSEVRAIINHLLD